MDSQQSALPLIQDSLLRRMRTMFSLYHAAVDTMDLHHVNHLDACLLYTSPSPRDS